MYKSILKKEKNIIGWYLIDARNKILGRLATKIVYYLQGKHKGNYLPYLNIGDYVIVINARDILVSGNKKTKKFYYRHSGYIGNLRCISFKEMLFRNPANIIKLAVKGMLPKNIISRYSFKRLKIYSGNYHKHAAQKPIFLD